MNETSIPMQLAHRDIDRIRRYREFLDFYNGQHWEGRATRGDKRLTFNYAKVFIDKVTSYLMSGVSFAVDPVEDTDEARARAQRAEAALYQVYQDNNLEHLVAGITEDSAVYLGVKVKLLEVIVLVYLIQGCLGSLGSSSGLICVFYRVNSEANA